MRRNQTPKPDIYSEAPQTPPSSTPTCEPTHESRTPSPRSKTPASNACPSATSTPTPPGRNSSRSAWRWCDGSNNCACEAHWLKPPQTPQMATMARTRPARALLKKMDPAPARLVARHSATAARLQPRRPIDTRHPAPAPARRQNSHPARPHTQTRAQTAPTRRTTPTRAPNTTQPANPPPAITRKNTIKHKPEPLTNSRERSGLDSRVMRFGFWPSSGHEWSRYWQ